MRTKHGYHISGTIMKDEFVSKTRCGGPSRCRRCQDDIKKYWAGQGLSDSDKFNRFDTSEPTGRAKKFVFDVVESEFEAGLEERPLYHVYIVFFTYILGGWKAMVSTSLPDGKYYEVTYNYVKEETYIDVYERSKNIVIRDEDT